MGLCKCPKKVVSNLFCFDHRVTVCESCLVLNHRKCVIKSYLEWLKDSDFDSACSLCGTNLEDEDCIRLVCYDLFHKKCLNERQELQIAKNPNTAPSGHSCPSCSTGIFPHQNLVSPVADTLRIWLSQVSWGRNEMNMPTLTEEKEFTVKPPQHEMQIMNGTAAYNSSGHHRTNLPEKVFRPESPHSILNIDSRPLLREPPIGAGADRDESYEKYKRKTPQEIFSRWSRQFYSPAARPPWRRTWFVVTAAILLICSVIYLMYHFGRAPGDNDELSGVHYDE